MAIVFQSSWFWLAIIATLVTIAGCVVLFSYQATPKTQSAGVSMSQPVYRPAYIPPDSLHFRSEQQLFNPIPTTIPIFGVSPPPDDGLLIESARCFQLANSGYSCLGEVLNESTETYGRLSLQLRQVQPHIEGNLSNTIDVLATTEQRLLAPDTAVPYRILIPPEVVQVVDDEPDFEINVRLIRAYPPLTNMRTLTVVQSDGELTEAGRYQVNVTFRNETGFSARNIRVITTLSNIEWGIVAYQVHEVVDVVKDGAIYDLTVEIIPHTVPDTIEYQIHVEGLVDS